MNACRVIFAIVSLSCYLLTGCHEVPKPQARRIEQIQGRILAVAPLYRVKVPDYWERTELADASSLDTTKPICEFQVQEESDIIRITIHDFPFDSQEARVPSTAQVYRWKQQFSLLNPTSAIVVPQSFGGFIGMRLEGDGILSDQEAAILAWSMQLAPEHSQTLLQLQTAEQSPLCADYTIKAVGPKHLIEKHRPEIIVFARSFELIQDLPNP